MNKRKILSLAMALSIVAIMAVGATLAYFTDTESATNTFTIGNVQIEQREHMRALMEDGRTYDSSQVVPFKDNHKDVLPATPATGYDKLMLGTATTDFPANYWVGMLNTENAVDKIVSVKNIGKNDAYVRTMVAIPVGLECGLNLITSTGTEGSGSANWNTELTGNVTIDGKSYYMYALTYVKNGGVLKKDEVTIPSLVQYYLKSTVTSEQAAAYGDTLKIYAFSQAVQADGFDTPQAAFNTAFGTLTEAQMQEWFNSTEIFPVESADPNA